MNGALEDGAVHDGRLRSGGAPPARALSTPGVRQMLRPTLRFAAPILLALPALGRAQCPEGTPPPCGGRPPTRIIPAVPAPADRARRFLILPFRNVTRQPDQDWLVEGSTTMLADALGRWEGISV